MRWRGRMSLTRSRVPPLTRLSSSSESSEDASGTRRSATVTGVPASTDRAASCAACSSTEAASIALARAWRAESVSRASANFEVFGAHIDRSLVPYVGGSGYHLVTNGRPTQDQWWLGSSTEVQAHGRRPVTPPPRNFDHPNYCCEYNQKSPGVSDRDPRRTSWRASLQTQAQAWP